MILKVEEKSIFGKIGFALARELGFNLGR